MRAVSLLFFVGVWLPVLEAFTVPSNPYPCRSPLFIGKKVGQSQSGARRDQGLKFWRAQKSIPVAIISKSTKDSDLTDACKIGMPARIYGMVNRMVKSIRRSTAPLLKAAFIVSFVSLFFMQPAFAVEVATKERSMLAPAVASVVVASGAGYLLGKTILGGDSDAEETKTVVATKQVASKVSVSVPVTSDKKPQYAQQLVEGALNRIKKATSRGTKGPKTYLDGLPVNTNTKMFGGKKSNPSGYLDTLPTTKRANGSGMPGYLDVLSTSEGLTFPTTVENADTVEPSSEVVVEAPEVTVETPEEPVVAPSSTPLWQKVVNNVVVGSSEETKPPSSSEEDDDEYEPIAASLSTMEPNSPEERRAENRCFNAIVESETMIDDELILLE